MKTRASNRQASGANGLSGENEASETEEERDALQETEIKLLNAAGFSMEALDDISYEEKVEILKAISESHPEPIEGSTKNEITTNRHGSQSLQLAENSSNKNETLEEGENNSSIDNSNHSCGSEESVTISSSKEDVSSNNSLITMSPLFKSKVLSARPTITEGRSKKTLKTKSLWSFHTPLFDQISPDQYTEVLKLVYDIYFRRLRKEQMLIKGPVNKWGKPVVPGPHIDGCLFAEKARKCVEKRQSNTSRDRVNGNNNFSDRDNNALNLNKENEDAKDCNERKFIQNVRDEGKNKKVDEKDDGDRDENSDDDFDIYPCHLKNQRKLLPSEKQKLTDESKVLKRKFESSKTKTDNSSKKINNLTADDPLDFLSSTRPIKKSRLNDDHKKCSNSPLYVWESGDSSDSDLVCKEDENSVFKSVNIQDNDENSKLNKSSILLKQLDALDDLDDTQVPDTHAKIQDLDDAKIETSLESADNKLSQESSSCNVSNSQSSNSLLDASGCIYSTQIAVRKRKLQLKTDQTQSSSAVDEDEIEGKIESKKRRVGDEGKLLKKKLDKTILKNTILAAPDVCDVLNQQDDTESYIVDYTRNNKGMTTECAETNYESEAEFNTESATIKCKKVKESTTLKGQQTYTNKHPDGNGDGINLLEKNDGCTSKAEAEDGGFEMKEKLTCPICGENFNQKDIEEHASVCGEEPVLKRCIYCHTEMDSDVLRKHEKMCSLKRNKRILSPRLAKS